MGINCLNLVFVSLLMIVVTRSGVNGDGSIDNNNESGNEIDDGNQLDGQGETTIQSGGTADGETEGQDLTGTTEPQGLSQTESQSESPTEGEGVTVTQSPNEFEDNDGQVVDDEHSEENFFSDVHETEEEEEEYRRWLDEEHFKILMDWYNDTEHPSLDQSKTEQEYFKNCSAFVDEEEFDDDYFQSTTPSSKNENQPRPLKPRAGETPCIRKEVRTMTVQEWEDYRNAFTSLHNTLVNGWTTEHNVLAGLHRSRNSPGAHFCPCFITFHREYISRFEMALKRHNPRVCSPMIDWRCDQPLPNPCDSCLFSPDFFGDAHGDVRTGFAAYWQPYPSNECGSRLRRDCVAWNRGKNLLFTDWSFDEIVRNYRRYDELCMPRYTTFEYRHGYPHVFCGGTMNSLSCAANDPVFFCHHTFIDYIYDNCHRKLPEHQRETGYPDWSELNENERARDPCKPFDDLNPPVRCEDGLKLHYSRLYSYMHPPKHCRQDSDCRTSGDRNALFCLRTIGRCCSKVKRGGYCGGLRGDSNESPCFQESSCNGRRATCRSDNYCAC